MTDIDRAALALYNMIRDGTRRSGKWMPDWQELPDGIRITYRDGIHKVLTELREMSPNMIGAGDHPWCEDIWQGIIDAILTEEP